MTVDSSATSPHAGASRNSPETATASSAVVARVYIVRHGETEHNRQGIIQGHLDTPLNATGIEQARLAADALADVPFGTAYSSDLQRARKVAIAHISPRACAPRGLTPSCARAPAFSVRLQSQCAH